jgi:hypothetical protein
LHGGKDDVGTPQHRTQLVEIGAADGSRTVWSNNSPGQGAKLLRDGFQ